MVMVQDNDDASISTMVAMMVVQDNGEDASISTKVKKTTAQVQKTAMKVQKTATQFQKKTKITFAVAEAVLFKSGSVRLAVVISLYRCCRRLRDAKRSYLQQ